MKRLAVLVALFLFFCPLAFAQEDTLGLSLTVAGYGVFPAYSGAPTYDPSVGISVVGEKTLSEKVSMGIAYFSWKAKGQSVPNMVGQTIGTEVSYWVLPIERAKFNFSFNTLPAYSTIDDGTSSDAEFTLMSSVGVRYKLKDGIYTTAKVNLVKFGAEKTDAFAILFGMTFDLLK